jgi:hypothetical protein
MAELGCGRDISREPCHRISQCAVKTVRKRQRSGGPIQWCPASEHPGRSKTHYGYEKPGDPNYDSSVIFLQSRNTYGCRRIQQMLRRQGIQCGKNRIRRLMDQQGLQRLQKRRFRPKTTESRHDQPIIAPNRLKEVPELAQRPNEVWTADITTCRP